MYVCMYVCMYLCMYVCMYVRMYVCMYINVSQVAKWLNQQNVQWCIREILNSIIVLRVFLIHCVLCGFNHSKLFVKAYWIFVFDMHTFWLCGLLNKGFMYIYVKVLPFVYLPWQTREFMKIRIFLYVMLYRPGELLTFPRILLSSSSVSVSPRRSVSYQET